MSAPRQPAVPSQFLTLVAVAAPLLVGLLLAYLMGDGVLWPVAAGTAVGIAALYLRVAGPGGGPSASARVLVEMLDAGDFESAVVEARERLKLPPASEDQLRRLRDRASFGAGFKAKYRESLERMAMTLTSLSEGLTQQVSALEEVSRSLEERLQFHQGLSESVDGLSHSAEESSSSILEMVAINNEVRENIHNLALSVQETTSAIEEMTFSSKEVAKNIEELSTAAEETAASMNEMDVSISQVESNANETSKLSETVTKDAETGVTAINRTIDGIDKIKESSRIAADVIQNLGQKINEIGNILNVIDDVAEQTNLLALNAAIIAAQAGEHGRGFAVVADEIKALAERTGASTKEIADLIKAVQDESKNAVSVMSRGVENVEEGVRLGHDAEDALRKIVESAKRSTLMIQAIAQATVEQAKGSKQVTNAISRIAETVQQIAFATAEQAKGSEHIMQSAERMKVITQQVERSADEQNRGGRQVTEAIENIREMVERISKSQRQQTDAQSRVTAATTQLTDSGERAVGACRELERYVGELSGLADQVLR